MNNTLVNVVLRFIFSSHTNSTLTTDTYFINETPGNLDKACESHVSFDSHMNKYI